MKLKFNLLILFESLLFINPFFAQISSKQTPLLSVGDKSPPLIIEKWIKGGGFSALEKGKVYVIDIWAIWCTPCIAGMPYLSKIQKNLKDKGVEIIGITSEDKWGNTLDRVEKFVQKKDSLMNYNVAWVPSSMNEDSLQGIFVHPWMQMIGNMNIPTAFIVDRNGFIAYIGDPHGIDMPLKEIANNTYNLEIARTKYQEGLKAKGLLENFNVAIRENKINEELTIGNQILTDFSYVRSVTYLGLASAIVEMKGDIDTRLLDIALIAAKQGVVDTQFESPGYLDLLATVHAKKGDYFQAVVAEKLAVSVSEGVMKDNQMNNVKKYLLMIGRK